MAIYRFGSWGTANQRRDSDIDIALLAARPIFAISLWELSQRLAQLDIGKINALFWRKGKY
jgi:predicted nucleotidyltransferase